jgi:Domain of Unknown Function (DUF928)
MNNLSFLSACKSLALAIAWVCMSLVDSPIALADSFNPPSQTGSGSPSSTVPAGTHGPCETNSTNQESLTALLPKQQGWITTTQSHPTFWFYVPFSTDGFASMRLVIQNETTRETIGEPIPITAKALPGIVSVSIPETAPALQPNQTYRWIFVLTCTGGTELAIRNRVTVVSPSPALASALQSAGTPEAKAAVYAQNGIWLDALTLLGDRRRTNPSDSRLAAAWTELLSDEDIGMGNLATKPIVDCCTAGR